MGLPQQTVSAPTEKPSTSETSVSYPQDSVPAAEVSDQNSSVGATGGSKIGEGKMSAEEAAEKVYEERIEDEYAKREGGA